VVERNGKRCMNCSCQNKSGKNEKKIKMKKGRSVNLTPECEGGGDEEETPNWKWKK
jgi:hypothetical protein